MHRTTVVVTVEQDGPFDTETCKQTSRDARLYQLAQMLGASIGVGHSLPLSLSRKLRPGETVEQAEAVLSKCLSDIIAEAKKSEALALWVGAELRGEDHVV